MSDHITITRKPGAQSASFDTINITQSQMVYWKNEDNAAHWPTFPPGNPPQPPLVGPPQAPPSLPNQVGPNSTSDSLQPALALGSPYYPGPNNPGPNPLPQGTPIPAAYSCQLHTGETGTINIYADFYSQPSQLPNAIRGVNYSANLTNGGIPAFTFRVSNSNLPASLKVAINSQSQGPAVGGTPGSGDAGSFAFDLYCEDADGNNITQTYLLTVS